jgi:hypothetical protein
VFLIHPVVIVGMTSLYAWCFNEIVAVENCIFMTDGPLYGLPPLGQGGGRVFPYWLVVGGYHKSSGRLALGLLVEASHFEGHIIGVEIAVFITNVSAFLDTINR